jgi:hypothetical protein
VQGRFGATVFFSSLGLLSSLHKKHIHDHELKKYEVLYGTHLIVIVTMRTIGTNFLRVLTAKSEAKQQKNQYSENFGTKKLII